jgi:hypothetical protein
LYKSRTDYDRHQAGKRQSAFASEEAVNTSMSSLTRPRSWWTAANRQIAGFGKDRVDHSWVELVQLFCKPDARRLHL